MTAIDKMTLDEVEEARYEAQRDEDAIKVRKLALKDRHDELLAEVDARRVMEGLTDDQRAVFARVARADMGATARSATEE